MASLELASISIRNYAFEIVNTEVKRRLLPLLTSAAKSIDGGLIDLQDVFRRFSFDNICKFSFGLDPGCLESSLPISVFAESFDLASKLSAERAMATLPLVWKIKRFLNMGTEKHLREAIEVVGLLADEVIMQKRKLGRDTMASALTTFFWLLATHPKVVSRVREESDQVMASNQELASYEQIREMHYLHAVVNESLRLYPPVQFDSKFAMEDDVLPDGTFVRKGTRVTYHPYAMGRMEGIWGTDCMEFRPERWLENGTFCPISPFKCPVFQAGIRVCLGKEMSLVEMKIVALAVLRKFDVKIAAPVAAPRFDPGLTAMLSGGLQAEIRERVIAE
ncbi:hypothetical protein OIU78_005827 [Salix suchowensis]|nr:hypothetical protein OIU78_005827 [Salix suchowensis]